MKPLEQAYYDPVEVEQNIQAYIQKWKDGMTELRQHFGPTLVDAEKQIRAFFKQMGEEEMVFKNDVYQVAVRRVGDTNFHLSIKRIDRQPIHDWRDLQEIKNQILGPECEAVELYPAESRRVDTANQFHLWGTMDESFRFPLGWNSGRIVTEESIGQSVNRPIVG